jgi:hypothetical protein
MRKAALLLAGMLIGGAVGVTGWQIADAGPIDTITVCTRPGTDVRTPATNGTCPSGYTKTEISDGEDGQDGLPGADAENPAWVSSGFFQDYTDDPLDSQAVIPAFDLPPGSYTAVAHGNFEAGVGSAELTCFLTKGPLLGDVGAASGHDVADDRRTPLTIVTWFTHDLAGNLRLRCSALDADDPTEVVSVWRLVVTRVSSINEAAP